jgi:competence protein ComEC
MKAVLTVLLFCLALPCARAFQSSDTLEIWVIDVEGGKAMIAKSPSGQTIMVDGGVPAMSPRPGMPDIGPRDLNRVTAAAKAAGISQFDVHLVTHYDWDHAGNVHSIAGQLPAKLYMDHGPLLPTTKPQRALDDYLSLFPAQKRLSVKPGDKIPIKGVDITVLTSNEQIIQKPLPGGGQANAACPATPPEVQHVDDNAACVGTLWQFGKFRMADFADLLQWMEVKLMCPSNPIGTVDLLMGSHHGLTMSNNAALVHALRPKVTIVNNGETKGIAPEVAQILRSSPGSPDIWQMHYSKTAGAEFNAPEQFIANMSAQDCQGFAVKVTARRDGSFTVTNLRNQFAKTYKP